MTHMKFIEQRLGTLIVEKSVAFLSYRVSQAAFETQTEDHATSDEDFTARFRTALSKIENLLEKVKPLIGIGEEIADNYLIENFLY